MYLTRFTIENLRAIRKLEWKVSLEQAPGWHVILGDNGSGKSSVLRSIALALVGPDELSALRQDWERWRRGTTAAGVHLSLVPEPRFDKIKGKKPSDRAGLVHVGVDALHGEPMMWMWAPSSGGRFDSSVWKSKTGWFSAAFGPFRRFTGGNQDDEKHLDAYPRLARHLSVFEESVALTEGLKWLQQLKFKKLEKDPDGDLLEPLTKFINQPDFLPHRAHLEKITSARWSSWTAMGTASR